MKRLYIANFSAGKDSLAMVLLLLRMNKPLDGIAFFDTGTEFPFVYRTINKLVDFSGKEFFRITAKYSFEHYLLYGARDEELPDTRYSFPFPTKFSRWCTGLKVDSIKRFFKEKFPDVEIFNYIGIASDELSRVRLSVDHYPLIQYGVTEKEALKICYSNGFDFEGYYDKHSRLGCWFCPLQSLEDLRILRTDYPDLWEKLLYWQKVKGSAKYKDGLRVDELEMRFLFEEFQKKVGRETAGTLFYNDLRLFLECYNFGVRID